MRNEQECKAIIESVEAILSEAKVLTALDRLLAQAERDRITHSIERMRRRMAYVAVIGSQGSGKSSFLNSLLFTARTLPVGEGVTTNIVCYVREAEGINVIRCEVLLNTGETLALPLSRNSLERYMDEAHNPGNQLRVNKVTCFIQHSLLTNNTVFVDTPGLDPFFEALNNPSMPSHNADTLAFVGEIALGIFVLRTTPTLTKSEAEFLKGIWRLCPEIIFIQNVWGEADSQVSEALWDNTEKIRKIAISQGDDRRVSIFPVNIHEGLEGVTNERPQFIHSSGLAALRSAIYDRVARGGQRLEISLQGRKIIQCLQVAIKQGVTEAAAASVHEDRDTERLREKIEEAEEKLGTIQSKHRKLISRFDLKCGEIISESKENLRKKIEVVRQEFSRNTVEDSLGDEYSIRLKRAASDGFDDFKLRFAKVCEDFTTDSAREIDDIAKAFQFTTGEIPSNPDDNFGPSFAEIVGKITKWGSTIALTSLTGLSAAAFGTTLAAGSTLTVALTAGATAIPVVGWVIAGIPLLVGHWINKFANEQRKSALLNAIDRAAREVLDRTETSIATEANRIHDVIRDGVKETFKAALEQQKKFLNSCRDGLYRSEEEKKLQQATLQAMITDLETAAVDIENLTQLGE